MKQGMLSVKWIHSDMVSMCVSFLCGDERVIESGIFINGCDMRTVLKFIKNKPTTISPESDHLEIEPMKYYFGRLYLKREDNNKISIRSLYWDRISRTDMKPGAIFDKDDLIIFLENSSQTILHNHYLQGEVMDDIAPK